MDHSAYKLLKLPIPEVTVRTTYCLLCRWSNYILQPLYSESCHQETIAIALPQLVFNYQEIAVMQRDIAKNCFSNSCRAKRWFCFFHSDFQILLSLMIDLHAFRKLEVPEARYSSFLKGTLRSSLLMSRISETLSNVTQRIVAKASRPKMDDTLLNRDISDNPSGMYSSET